jgi:hypothetical protein
MRRDQLPQHTRPNYVLPQYKAVYVAVSKAACTSLKWLVAELQGEDSERFHGVVSPMVSRDMTIHHRGLFQRTPTLDSLSDEELDAIASDNGWFVFSVVRHPSARFFSAWQSKMLLREPRYVEKHKDEAWFPRIPQTTADVVEDFERFTLAAARHPNGRVMRNRHFMPQWMEAAPERIAYTKVYDTSEIPVLLADFERHLRANGWDGDELRLRQTNETPLRPVHAAFSPSVCEALSSLRAGDLRAFGYDDVVPPKLAPGDEYPNAAFEEIGRIIERHERIGDLARSGREARAALAEAQRAAKKPPAAANGRPSGVRAFAGRVRRRVGAARPR